MCAFDVAPEAVNEYCYDQTVLNEPLSIRARGGMFSPVRPDAGTLAMLSGTEFRAEDKVLDMGCGTGIVGILALRKGARQATFSDIDPVSVEYAQLNCKKNLTEVLQTRCKYIVSDAFDAIPDSDYTLILSNPPYHTDFSVAKAIIEGAFRHLAVGGRILMVTKRLDWYKNKLTAVFGGVKVFEADGYFVFESEKRDTVPANVLAARKKAALKQAAKESADKKSHKSKKRGF